MSMFILAISCLITSNLPWFMDLTFQVPTQYFFFTALEFTFTIRHIQNCTLILLWLSLFIPSRAISLLFSSGIYWCGGEFIFQCRIFLPLHTIHGVLKARMLKWFAIPFSSGPRFVRILHLTCPSWVALHGMAHSFIELDRLWSMWSVWLVFCDCGFPLSCECVSGDES